MLLLDKIFNTNNIELLGFELLGFELANFFFCYNNNKTKLGLG